MIRTTLIIALAMYSAFASVMVIEHNRDSPVSSGLHRIKLQMIVRPIQAVRGYVNGPSLFGRFVSPVQEQQPDFGLSGSVDGLETRTQFHNLVEQLLEKSHSQPIRHRFGPSEFLHEVMGSSKTETIHGNDFSGSSVIASTGDIEGEDMIPTIMQSFDRGEETQPVVPLKTSSKLDTEVPEPIEVSEGMGILNFRQVKAAFLRPSRTAKIIAGVSACAIMLLVAAVLIAKRQRSKFLGHQIQIAPPVLQEPLITEEA